MAEGLARIFGTEKDKVNCPFYFKIGACRHGDMCSRLHNKPTISETVLLKNMYQNPLATAVSVDGSALEMDEKELQHHFEEFYEDVFSELSNFGKLEMLHVCDNLGDHLLGNVYAKFKTEEDADKAVKGLTGRFYAQRPIMVEFSPVTDFKEARCRQFDVSDCTRGGYCNFMHLKQIGPELSRKLFGTSRPAEHEPHKRRSPDRRDYRDRDRGGRGGGGGYRGDRDRRDDRYDSRDRDRGYRRDDRDRDRDHRDNHRDSRDRERDADRDRYGDRRRDRDDRGGDSRGGSGASSGAPGGAPAPQYPPYDPSAGAAQGQPPAYSGQPPAYAAGGAPYVPAQPYAAAPSAAPGGAPPSQAPAYGYGAPGDAPYNPAAYSQPQPPAQPGGYQPQQ